MSRYTGAIRVPNKWMYNLLAVFPSNRLYRPLLMLYIEDKICKLERGQHDSLCLATSS